MTNNIEAKVVHVSTLKEGDTVLIDNKLDTVSVKYLKKCNFMGYTYKGRQFRDGITKITFAVPTANGIRYE